MSSQIRRRSWLIVMLGVGLAVVSSGCGPANPLGRKAVEGSVTLNGAPVLQGGINFVPIDGQVTSSGAMILDGKYSIGTPYGIADGKYLVRINGIDPSSIRDLHANHIPGNDHVKAEEIIPAEWNIDSDKTIEVSGKAPVTFDFEITSE